MSVRPPRRDEQLDGPRLEELFNAGWRFRQKTLYSKGQPGDVAVFHLGAGWPMWATPPAGSKPEPNQKGRKNAK